MFSKQHHEEVVKNLSVFHTMFVELNIKKQAAPLMM